MASRVVLGLGGGVDVEVEVSASTLERLVDEFQIHDAELTSPATVDDERDLLITVVQDLAKRFIQEPELRLIEPKRDGEF